MSKFWNKWGVVDREELGLAVREPYTSSDVTPACSMKFEIVCKVDDRVERENSVEEKAKVGHVVRASGVHDPSFVWGRKLASDPVAVVAVIDGESVLSESMSLGFELRMGVGAHICEHNKEQDSGEDTGSGRAPEGPWRRAGRDETPWRRIPRQGGVQ